MLGGGKVLDKEKEIEAKLIAPDFYGKSLFDYAVKAGKRVIITSDMYYSASFLSDILHNCGYYGFEKVFVSSEYGKSKLSGKLYRVVAKELGLEPGTSILHIGNNILSDVFNAKRSGWNAVHFLSSEKRLMSEQPRLKFLRKSSLANSMIIGLLKRNQNSDGSFWEQFGYNYVGPVVYSFARSVQKKVEKENIDKVLFIARGGYLAKRVFDIVSGMSEKSHYVYAQRTICASCDADSYRKYPPVSFMRFDPLKNYLTSFKKEIPFEESDVKSFRMALRFLKKHRVEYDALSAKTRKFYKDYLYHELGDNLRLGSRVLCVDDDSAYKSAQTLIENTLKDVASVQAEYFWFVPLFKSKKNTCQFIPFLYAFPTPKTFGVFIEFFMSSTEHKVLALDSSFKPVYQDPTEKEKNRSLICEQMIKGAEDFAKDFVDTFGNNTKFMMSKAETARYLRNLFFSPTKKDIEMFKGVEQPFLNDVKNATITPIPFWKFAGRFAK